MYQHRVRILRSVNLFLKRMEWIMDDKISRGNYTTYDWTVGTVAWIQFFLGEGGYISILFLRELEYEISNSKEQKVNSFEFNSTLMYFTVFFFFLYYEEFYTLYQFSLTFLRQRVTSTGSLVKYCIVRVEQLPEVKKKSWGEKYRWRSKFISNSK